MRLLQFGKLLTDKIGGEMIVYRLRGNRFVSLYCSDVPEKSIYPEYDYVSFSLDKNFNYTGGAIAYCKSEIVEKFIIKRDKEGKTVRQEL